VTDEGEIMQLKINDIFTMIKMNKRRHKKWDDALL
jgi:hypothetical protein